MSVHEWVCVCSVHTRVCLCSVCTCVCVLCIHVCVLCIHMYVSVFCVYTCVCVLCIHMCVCVLCIHVCVMCIKMCVCSMHTRVHTCGVPFMHRDQKRRLVALFYYSAPDSAETASFTEPGARLAICTPQWCWNLHSLQIQQSRDYRDLHGHNQLFTRILGSKLKLLCFNSKDT